MRVEELLKCTSKLRKRPTGSLKKQKKKIPLLFMAFTSYLARAFFLFGIPRDTTRKKKKEKVIPNG